MATVTKRLADLESILSLTAPSSTSIKAVDGATKVQQGAVALEQIATDVLQSHEPASP
jgi:hypothetical protein